MTPLQAANLAATIVNGGRVAEPALVKEIDFADGQRLAALRSHASPSAHGQISPRTAAMLRRGMEQVVASGTGRGLHRAAWPLAGKSGTAESGRPGAGNSQWFIGYGPADHPRYAVAVLAEERPEEAPTWRRGCSAASWIGSRPGSAPPWPRPPKKSEKEPFVNKNIPSTFR